MEPSPPGFFFRDSEITGGGTSRRPPQYPPRSLPTTRAAGFSCRDSEITVRKHRGPHRNSRTGFSQPLQRQRAAGFFAGGSEIAVRERRGVLPLFPPQSLLGTPSGRILLVGDFEIPGREHRTEMKQRRASSYRAATTALPLRFPMPSGRTLASGCPRSCAFVAKATCCACAPPIGRGTSSGRGVSGTETKWAARRAACRPQQVPVGRSVTESHSHQRRFRQARPGRFMGPVECIRTE